MAESGGSCRCCCSFILTLGLTALFMWLSLRTSNPSCSIQYFYLPGLNKTLNSTRNHTLYFMVRLDNTNKDKGVFYDSVNLTFFDFPNRSHVIGNYTIPKFRQGHKKKAEKNGNVETNWRAVSRAVWPNSTAVFRVDLATQVRFKIIFWKTKRQKIMVGADVVVNDTGTFDHKANKKGIRLKSGAAAAAEHGRFCLVESLDSNLLGWNEAITTLSGSAHLYNISWQMEQTQHCKESC
ncbi:protein NDR1-like isoform X2 [Carica papaya]|uniref:protein NDR1-like isoform X2 n=1 Tax=Carica papaya TaxID=3649 RepID=UPI000B8C8B26|nr:protein NDR1-like isoform X2 [Carica papaya]